MISAVLWSGQFKFFFIHSLVSVQFLNAPNMNGITGTIIFDIFLARSRYFFNFLTFLYFSLVTGWNGEILTDTFIYFCFLQRCLVFLLELADPFLFLTVHEKHFLFLQIFTSKLISCTFVKTVYISIVLSILCIYIYIYIYILYIIYFTLL